MDRRALTDSEIQTALSDMTGWVIQEGMLHKKYKFPSFAKAIGWMMAASIECDKMDHHPEWCNVYNRVSVNLITHDMNNAISTWDIALAKKFDALL